MALSSIAVLYVKIKAKLERRQGFAHHSGPVLASSTGIDGEFEAETAGAIVSPVTQNPASTTVSAALPPRPNTRLISAMRIMLEGAEAALKGAGIPGVEAIPAIFLKIIAYCQVCCSDLTAIDVPGAKL